MATYKKRPDFVTSEEGLEFIEGLRLLLADSAYNTEPGFSANTELYPDHSIPFVNKHIDYIRNHPTTDPRHYLANLRLMTRKR
jgi:hypothetical protein